MTSQQRMLIPDDIHTNGATPNPWWSNAVVYQIYPRSFQDTNGDGFGDLKGITSRLDYLADLGVDVLWLSPVYKSPQDDNGYDISDYQDIDPLFGTLEDMDELLAEAHKRGLKIVMDLVVNHTSDEHAWFEASKDKNDPHADWYWWRPAKPGHEPGTPGAEPNEWGGTFGGSAWEYSPERGEYYLHTFSKKQPDLNWENPAVRRAVYDMMNWWMDRGVDGFRMDVITLISKHVDANGELPGVAGSLSDDLPVGEEGYSSPWPFSMDGPRLDEFLAEMRREVFEGREGFLTVGEAQGVTPERNEHITDPDNGELDMLFLFDHIGIDQPAGKWDMTELELHKLKRSMVQQQKSVAQRGWSSLFFNNHDQPRSVSRWGDDSNEEMRVASAKALAMLLHLHRGTPYIYQGEELGMTNAHFASLDQYRDLESLNAFDQRVNKAKIQDAASMMCALAKASRDNSRTPMQWDASEYAGFTMPDAAVEPWISVNPNHAEINAAAEFDDPDSVYGFYKKLIAMRHNDSVVAAGSFHLLDEEDAYVYSFTRTLDATTLLVVINVSSRMSCIPSQTAAALDKVSAEDIVLTGTNAEAIIRQIQSGTLMPWSAFAVEFAS
ncbi:glycoside hydrolase family 13 protein [Bifidobacterium eulemuris]|uniref:Alpha-amylase n=1 Tax=Bifidobacterium eulemuris TaxID=1765219 RepID=A0A261G384_9BIFI|nr:alpha-glucosidase [Bifidobacterium eulemuris]OZG65887.1 alpha-amylase [Bifidobacterium eulemuris]QOL31958.1 alpha-glucosidase [Bifidobacterium eulemuris]